MANRFNSILYGYLPCIRNKPEPYQAVKLLNYSDK